MKMIKKEPMIRHNTMAQTNGSAVEDVPDNSTTAKHAPDNINHPAHYTYAKLEVIDAIEGLELPYHLGNALKYIARAGRKDPAKTEEDLRKALWYIERYIELLKREGKA